MFPKFDDVVTAIEDLIGRGLVRDYAVFGSIAQMFWDEAIPTWDLDVLVLLGGPQGRLIDMTPIFDWARENGYEIVEDHIRIGEIPVQFVPAPTPLHEEAIQNAATRPASGASVRVVRPEYLIATWLQPPANNPVRRERAARLREYAQIDQQLLNSLLERYGLSW